MDLTIVPLYAALLAIGLILLSVRVIRLRRAAKVAVGTSGEPLLDRAIRAQGNFSEYVPLAVILLAFVEVNGGPGWLLHGLCLALLIGRAVHAFGVSRVEEDYRFRVFGMATTFTVLAIASMVLLTGGSLLTGLIG